MLHSNIRIFNCSCTTCCKIILSSLNYFGPLLKIIWPFMCRFKLQYFATWCEELTHLKRPWFWERLRAGGGGDDRGWGGWMASLTQWSWVWVDSGSWWWTGRPGMLQFMGSWRVRHDWTTELNWTDFFFWGIIILPFDECLWDSNRVGTGTKLGSSDAFCQGFEPWEARPTNWMVCSYIQL